MWPWGHLAFGYLIYAGYVAATKWRAPRGWPVVALAAGTQFPDLVDKPLAYWFGVLPEGRMLAHSIVVFVPAGLLVIGLAAEYRSAEAGTAFTIGWGSHLVGDALGPLADGAYGQASFLLWPLLPVPDYEAPNFAFHARQLLADLAELDVATLVRPGENLFVLQLWLAGLVFLLWVAQGMPPLGSMRRWLAATVDGRRPSR